MKFTSVGDIYNQLKSFCSYFSSTNLTCTFININILKNLKKSVQTLLPVFIQNFTIIALSSTHCQIRSSVVVNLTFAYFIKFPKFYFYQIPKVDVGLTTDF